MKSTITFVINHHKDCIRIHLSVSHWETYTIRLLLLLHHSSIWSPWIFRSMNRTFYGFIFSIIRQHNFQSLLSPLSLVPPSFITFFCDLFDIEILQAQKTFSNIYWQHTKKMLSWMEQNSFNNAPLRVLMVLILWRFLYIHLKSMNCVIADKTNGINFDLKYETWDFEKVKIH